MRGRPDNLKRGGDRSRLCLYREAGGWILLGGDKERRERSAMVDEDDLENVSRHASAEVWWRNHLNWSDRGVLNVGNGHLDDKVLEPVS